MSVEAQAIEAPELVTAPLAASPWRARAKRLALMPGFPAGVLLVALVAVVLVRSPQLFSAEGLRIGFAVMTPLALAAMAITPAAIAGRGGVDLSIGPVIAFINVTIVTMLVAKGITSPIAILAWVLIAGIGLGALQGAGVAYLRVQPVIVTLGGFLVLSGLSLTIMPKAGGSVPDWLKSMSRSVFGIPVPALILLLAIAVWLVVKRTAFFRQVRLLGSNERAAFTSGIPIGLVRVGAYAFGGFFAALAGLMSTALLSSGQPNQGTLYTLSALTALVLGGTSLSGGSGGLLLSLLGAIDIFMIQYVLATFDFGKYSGFIVQFSYGAILVLALVAGMFVTRLARRGK